MHRHIASVDLWYNSLFFLYSAMIFPRKRGKFMGSDYASQLAASVELIQQLEKENQLQAKLIQSQRDMIRELENYSADLQNQINGYLRMVQEG